MIFASLFYLFQFIRDKFDVIKNQQSLSIDIDNKNDNEILNQISLHSCFSSFSKIRENYNQEGKQVVNTITYKPSLKFILEEIICSLESSLALDLQPPNSIDFQIVDEDLEAETCDQMMQDDSIQLCFEEFQFLKENFHNISNEKDEDPVQSHEDALEPMRNGLQQYFEVFHDTIADVFDDIYSKIPSPLANCEHKKSVDINLL